MQRELVVRAIGGDYEAFSSLVRASAARQYAIATLILRDPDAWDAWLHRLTVRACYAAARREKRRTVVELHVTLDDLLDGAPDAPMAHAERDRLERELSRLSIDQRAVIVLHFYVGLPLTDAAAVLNVPVGTAKSRLNRGLSTLRSSMGAGGGPAGVLPRETVA